MVAINFYSIPYTFVVCVIFFLASIVGAIVRAFDTRLETKDQVESMGGEFLVLDFGSEEGGDASGYATVSSDF